VFVLGDAFATDGITFINEEATTDAPKKVPVFKKFLRP
jgi:hypothetical protein